MILLSLCCGSFGIGFRLQHQPDPTHSSRRDADGCRAHGRLTDDGFIPCTEPEQTSCQHHIWTPDVVLTEDEHCRYFLFPFLRQVWQIRWRLQQQTWWSETGSLFTASETVLLFDFDIFVSWSRPLKPPDDAGQPQETQRKYRFSLNQLNMIKKLSDRLHLVNQNSEKYGVVFRDSTQILKATFSSRRMLAFPPAASRHLSVFSGTTESEIWTINTFKTDKWLKYLATQLLMPRNDQISQSERVNNTRQAWRFWNAPGGGRDQPSPGVTSLPGSYFCNTSLKLWICWA